MPLGRTRFILIGADVLAVPLALILSFLLRYGREVGTELTRPIPWAPIIIVLAGAIVPWLLLYQPISLDFLDEGWSLPSTVSRILVMGAIQMGVVLALAYLTRVYFSRLLLGYFAVTFCSLVLIARI